MRPYDVGRRLAGRGASNGHRLALASLLKAADAMTRGALSQWVAVLISPALRSAGRDGVVEAAKGHRSSGCWLLMSRGSSVSSEEGGVGELHFGGDVVLYGADLASGRAEAF